MAKQAFDLLAPQERERIIRAAVDEFNNSGAKDADMAVIAGNSGVSESGLRQYFEDSGSMLKTSLVWAVTYIIEKMEKEINAAPMPQLNKSGSTARG